jgi:protein-S-isoprenylcysteine O-methyltransferase Ste14
MGGPDHELGRPTAKILRRISALTTGDETGSGAMRLPNRHSAKEASAVEHQGVRQGRQVLFYLLTLIGGVGTVAGFLFALAATGALRLWGVGAIIAGIGLVALAWLVEGRRLRTDPVVKRGRHFAGSMSTFFGGVLIIFGVLWLVAAHGIARLLGLGLAALGAGLLYSGWRLLGRYLAS